MSAVEHIEVAPRMWDKSIAVPYTPSNSNKDTSNEIIQQSSAEDSTIDPTSVIVPATGLLHTLKTYLIPILFVLGVIIVIYVLWKYFTKYRKQKIEAAMNKNKDADSPNPDSIESMLDGDTSKYECESDNEDEPKIIETEEHEEHKEREEYDEHKMSTIEEIDEDNISDSSSENNADPESSNDEEYTDVDDIPVLESDHEIDNDMPDIEKIEELIASNTIYQFQEDYNIEYDEDKEINAENANMDDGNAEHDNMFSIELPIYESEEKEKTPPKKSRRNFKRVTM